MQRGERFLTFGRAQRATISSSTCKFFQSKITFRNKINPHHWLHFELSRLLEETDNFIKKYRSFESCRSFMFSCCVTAAVISPGSAMLFISLGSLGCRFSLRLDTDWDLPRWKNESQLPTGDLLALAGGRLQLQHRNKTCLTLPVSLNKSAR